MLKATKTAAEKFATEVKKLTVDFKSALNSDEQTDEDLIGTLQDIVEEIQTEVANLTGAIESEDSEEAEEVDVGEDDGDDE